MSSKIIVSSFKTGDIMDESILDSIKQLLGIAKEDDAFDNDILVNINSVFSTLYQLGVGTKEHYFVTNGEETWIAIFAEEQDLIDFIKLYTYMKVRVIFDPPTSSFVLESLNKQIQEIEWRITVQAESPKYFDSESVDGEPDLNDCKG